ncbi:BlaI/MecI/CopY family transcriptional regulator [Brevundimonas sp.]|uniref:BlaI/MecI/CopY family transcriptional regulator n=1 Tax=Brevundimonas sp. TaxID=1871086 RepID=UPI003D1348D8
MTIPVTEAESVILAALWRHGPLSFASLIEAVRAEQAWGDATIKTLLGRLMRKGAVRSERDDGRQRYHAAIERRDYLAGEVDALVARLFDGRREGLRAFLADD